MNRKFWWAVVFLAGFSLISGLESATTGDEAAKILTGADRIIEIADSMKNKTIAVVANHSSLIGQVHLVDSLVGMGVKVAKIFSPEHGFRGNVDAGEYFQDYTDSLTGLPVVSLYGKKFKPTRRQLKGIDLVIFDIQDVGVRFYTYISTLHYMMEACAENNIALYLLDRPNPNGFYVDGPVLDKAHSSFVGLHPIPLVYGMTIGELSLMINGEAWLRDGIKCNLSVIPCKGMNCQSGPRPTCNPWRLFIYTPRWVCSRER